jgi:hypothetical protein
MQQLTFTFAPDHFFWTEFFKNNHLVNDCLQKYILDKRL